MSDAARHSTSGSSSVEVADALGAKDSRAIGQPGAPVDRFA
jgi:hypothetical protein